MANNFQNFPTNQNNIQPTMPQMPVNNLPQGQVMLPNYQQNSILFPQPIGSVYNLNTGTDIGNIPTGAGVSVGLCLNENILYIKTFQNGSPMLLGYKLSPIEGHPSNDSDLVEENEKLKHILQSYDNRFSELEKQLNRLKSNVGGKSEWQI
jgi:hypothetical protein